MSEFREAFEAIFKVPDDVFWDGNSYLPKGEQPYSFESLDRACHLDSSLEGYAAAQSELSALREENERLKSESFEELYNAAIDERDALQEELAKEKRNTAALREKVSVLTDKWSHEKNLKTKAHGRFNAVSKRLTAAEQRNAVLTKALTTIRENSEDIGACECAADALADAALKPTESGASE